MSEARAYDGYRGAAFPPLPEPLPAGAFDSHCHLDILDVPITEVLAAARAVGIRRAVTVGYDVASSQWCADVAATYDDVYAAVAIHPNDAGDATEAALGDIARLAQRRDVRAVGETGLDYYRDWASPEDQQRSFRAHIEIAKRVGKALVVHDREAHADVLRILEEEGPPEHCRLPLLLG